MVSPETMPQIKTTRKPVDDEPARISFSADIFDDDDDSFISISPGTSFDNNEIDFGLEMPKKPAEFEFLSGKNSLDLGNTTMLTADELFFEGKLLPYSQINHATTTEKLAKISLSKQSPVDDEIEKPNRNVNGNRNGIEKLLGKEVKEPRIWFVDEDPSPRPPTCTALWKELLRLRKNRASTLSPSSSLSSSASSSSSSSLGGDAGGQVEETEKMGKIKRIKKGLERTRSSTLRIRPMVNVPICSQTGKSGSSSSSSSSLPPLFPLIRKKKIDR